MLTKETHPTQLLPVAALSDNYIWLMHRDGHAVVVDPGQAEPVERALRAQGLILDAILLTHHHGDHVGGVLALQAQTGATIYGPASEALPACDHRLRQGDTVHLPNFDMRLDVLDIPGHTSGHIAYFGHINADQPLVFCGDTLFAGGCGRLFEGTPAQMVDSLGKLAALPGNTLVCCAHEYTLANLRWAMAVEPGNAALRRRQVQAQRLRANGKPTLPTTIGLELETNPFVRTTQKPVMEAAAAHRGAPLASDVAVFACLREWKNDFK
jgi:hydroxyacylglutathione hydrolase